MNSHEISGSPPSGFPTSRLHVPRAIHTPTSGVRWTLVNAMTPQIPAAAGRSAALYLQVVPLTANDVGTALVVLFQVPLNPKPV